MFQVGWAMENDGRVPERKMTGRFAVEQALRSKES